MRDILKGRAPFPFENIATAIAFSPNSRYLVAESLRLCKKFRATLILIHVGEKDVEKEYQLQQLLAEFDTDGITIKAVWEEGDPVDVILKVCKDNVVDLLVAGALKKESFWTFYKGSVSRNLCRRAKCSLLILTEPKIEGTSFNYMVVNGVDHYKTPSTIKTSFYIAKYLQVANMDIIEEIDDNKLKTKVDDDLSSIQAKKEREMLIREEKAKMKQLLGEEEVEKILVKYDIVFGKPGFTIGCYTDMKKADLLVMNSPSERLGLMDRVFTRDLEHILNEMPSNLLLVHSRHDDKVKY